MSNNELNTEPLRAKDTPMRVIRFFYIVCWLSWSAIASLTVWALQKTDEGSFALSRDDIFSNFWWMTYLCAGLLLALRILLYWVNDRK